MGQKIKPARIQVKGETYLRLLIRTHEIKPPDQLADVVSFYTRGLLEPEDILVLSEKVVAAAQGRLVPTQTIHPSRLAIFLAGKVIKKPYGVGLSSPESMQVAINECGHLRILIAAFFGAIGRVLGIKGLFYRVAGRQAAWIDGDAPYGMLRGNVVKGPKNPDGVCQSLEKILKCKVAIMDVNDIGGCEICGCSRALDRSLIIELMRDNPMGQDMEQTPIAILRKARCAFPLIL